MSEDTSVDEAARTATGDTEDSAGDSTSTQEQAAEEAVTPPAGKATRRVSPVAAVEEATPDGTSAEPPREPPAEPTTGGGGPTGPDRRIWWIGGAGVAAVIVVVAVIAAVAGGGGTKAVKFAPDGWVYEKLTAAGTVPAGGMSDTAKALVNRLEAAGVKNPKYRATADAVYLAVPPAGKAALTHLDLTPPPVAVEEVVRSMPLANATVATCQQVLPATNAVTTGQCLIVGNPSLVSADIAGATIAKAGTAYTVTMAYTDAGIGKLIALSQAVLGRQVAYVMDGTVLSAPVVAAPITGPTVVATVATRPEADRIASTIDAAAHLVKLTRGAPQGKPIK